MAVDDKAVNPVEDFAHTTPDNKRGTYALMADGSVRWINDTIDKNVFLGMVTRAGGENLGDLDAKAPKVAAPKKEVQIKGAGGQAPLPGSAGGDARPDQTKIDQEELKKFQGDWKVTYAFIGGKRLPADQVAQMGLILSFDGEQFKMKGAPGMNDESSIMLELDPKAKPKVFKSKRDNQSEVFVTYYEFANEFKIKLRRVRDAKSGEIEVTIPEDGSTDLYLEIEK
jgi:uncharacterized protein (TIGR03067 family)